MALPSSSHIKIGFLRLLNSDFGVNRQHSVDLHTARSCFATLGSSFRYYVVVQRREEAARSPNSFSPWDSSQSTNMNTRQNRTNQCFCFVL
ncbi:hypothetical protein RB213_012154, partial [Colletotrichum asianum]